MGWSPAFGLHMRKAFPKKCYNNTINILRTFAVVFEVFLFKFNRDELIYQSRLYLEARDVDMTHVAMFQSEMWLPLVPVSSNGLIT